jgi:carbamoyl-phosphate synthase large subunit
MSLVFLLSGIGGDLAQSVARCLRDQYPDATLVGIDTNSEHAGSVFVDMVERVEHAKDKDYFTSLKSILRSTHPNFFFPLSDLELSELSSLTESELISLFGETQIVWSGARALSLFQSKNLTMEYLCKLGLNTPRVFNMDKNQIKFPVVIKPNEGSGSKKIYICTSWDELSAASVFIENPIIQEYIPGPESEYTVGVFARLGKNVKTISFRRKLSANGRTSWCETYYDPNLDAICKKVAESIELTGSINIQLRKNQGEYYIFEINPRFSSTVLIRHKLGFRDVIWSIEETSQFEKFDPALIKYVAFAVYQSEVKLD